MQIFIELVDKGKPFAAFKKLLGMHNKAEIVVHVKKIGLYREIVRLGEEIKKLTPSSEGRRKNFQQIVNLRQQIAEAIDRWDNEV